jgi:hypothetical protein
MSKQANKNRLQMQQPVIPLNRKALTKAWREAKLPRLYWRSAHPTWRDWDQGEIARSMDSPVQIHFYSLEAILDEIQDMRP